MMAKIRTATIHSTGRSTRRSNTPALMPCEVRPAPAGCGSCWSTRLPVPRPVPSVANSRPARKARWSDNRGASHRRRRPDMPAACLARIALAAAIAGALAVPAVAPAQTGGDAASQGWRRTTEPYFLGAGDRKWLKDYGVVSGRCNRQAVGAVVNAPPTGSEVARDEVATLRGTVAVPKVKIELTAADR